MGTGNHIIMEGEHSKFVQAYEWVQPLYIPTQDAINQTRYDSWNSGENRSSVIMFSSLWKELWKERNLGNTIRQLFAE
jgi:hypothetical protein